MQLDQLIESPALVIADLKAATRWEAIDELVSQLVTAGRISEDLRGPIAEAVHARERSMSTGIGNGIGIPHASTEHVDKIVGVFGRSREGIEFEAIDGQPVRLVTLFVVPRDQMQSHLSTLAGIARALSRTDLKSRLMEAADAQEVVAALRQSAN